MKYVLVTILALCFSAIGKSQILANLQSPGGVVRLEVKKGGLGEIRYSLFYKNQPVVLSSAVGMKMGTIPANQDLHGESTVFRNEVQVLQVDTSSFSEIWTPVWGEQKSIKNAYREVVLQLANKDGYIKRMNIHFRVFDDGLGFRYSFPQQEGVRRFCVVEELSEFTMTGDHKAWWVPGDYDTQEYQPQTTQLSQIDALAIPEPAVIVQNRIGSNFVQTPLMMKTSGGLYVNIHEAALVDYPAMHLGLDQSNFKFTSHLTPDPVGNKAYLPTPFRTPWRTIIVSDKATEILASKLILNLNEPSKIKDPSFCKPTKYVGIWWHMHLGTHTWDYAGGNSMQIDQTGKSTLKPHGKHGATTERTMEYIDFAAKHGFDGVLVEGWNTGWEDWFGQWKEEVFDFVTPYPDYDLERLSKYAKSKGVHLIMHHETSGSAALYDRQMDTAYNLMARLGIPAVKTGYVGKIIPRGEHHDGQWMVNHYQRSAEKLAQRRLMLCAHEPVRPTGLHRTWPNWLANEAARGNEFNGWSAGCKPEHETILPFTRLMGGPMDFTPGIFKFQRVNPNGGRSVEHSTLCKQLGLYLTMYSPLQMAMDLKENYEAKLDAFQFIKEVAVDWDESQYLAAEPGEYITVARKAKGKDAWFVGAITDEQQRNTTIPMQFLPANTQWVATVYRDKDGTSYKENPEGYVIEKWIVQPGTQLQLTLGAGGGAAMSLYPATKDDLGRYQVYPSRSNTGKPKKS